MNLEQSNINIAESISTTINNLFSNLFSSIDNNLYSTLDDLLFINTDILKDSFFKKIIGTSSTEGLLLICNSIVLGFILYYLISLLLSHITFVQVQKPTQFIFKLIICVIFVNFSYFICEKIIYLFETFSLSIREIGENIFGTSICLSNFIEKINSIFTSENFTFNIFTIDGLIKSFTSFSLLNLALSYALRYIILKVFLLLTPFAFLSLCLQNTSWFFKSWLKTILSLLFLQLLVSIILLIGFSISESSSNLFLKLLYVGTLYALTRANTFIKEFMGGLSTDVSIGINYLKSFISGG